MSPGILAALAADRDRDVARALADRSVRPQRAAPGALATRLRIEPRRVRPARLVVRLLRPHRGCCA